jgi:energy-coupling factor transport system permease protein
MNADRLDSRVWLLWGLCAMVPMLVSRHPLVVLEMLAIVMAVRLVWADRLVHGWGWIARVAAVFVLIGIVFNALTVNAGNQVLVHIPDSLPLIGGAITLNAIVYGLVTGLAMLTLVLTGTTIAAGLVWADLVRTLPRRVAPLAVAGSVAWSFLPGASRAFVDIRESQASRGHELRGVRDVPQLVVPLIEGGLERALTMSEALEARGFGASTTSQPDDAPDHWSLVTIVGGLVVGAYALAMGRSEMAAGGFLIAVVAGVILARGSSRGDERIASRQRYRVIALSTADRIVGVTSLSALVLFLWRQSTAGSAAVFNPYPEMSMPGLDVATVLSLALLLMPAAIAPAGEGD